MTRRSIILETIVGIVSHTVLLVSLFFLFAGHNAPGGGFAGGLIASCVLILRFIADEDPTVVSGVAPETIMGTGVGLAALTGVGAWIWGEPLLTVGKVVISIPLIGEVKILSALIFDIGVYLTIIGFVLMILRIFGEEREGMAK